MRRALSAASLVFLSMTGEAVRAQTPAVQVDERLPFATRRAIDIALDAPDASVRSGETVVAAGDSVSGSLVQVGGRLTIEGVVAGNVTAIDAVVRLRPSAIVSGRISVLAGEFHGTTLASLAGPVLWLRDEPLRVVETPPGGLLVEFVPSRDPPFPVGLAGIYGLVIREYNNVDGLSFGIEAALRQRAAWPRTELRGGPVFRTARLEEVGWEVAGLRELPRLGGVTLGGRVYSISDSNQRWHRPDFANSVAALLFANEGRAYHEREGYELWLERSFVRSDVTLRARWRDDDFDSLDEQRPLALLADDGDWPANPPVEPGRGRALGTALVWDRRDHRSFTTAGTFAEARYDHWGLGGDFGFDHGEIDLRGWLPTGERSFAALRVMAGGRLGAGDSLAPQFLYRLGGAGTVVGYDALDPELTGDRMAFANLRYHLAVASPGRVFRTLWLVGLADIGDAWFPSESAAWNTGLGAGLAGRGQTAYLGAYAAYGFESKEWKAYLVVRPWF